EVKQFHGPLPNTSLPRKRESRAATLGAGPWMPAFAGMTATGLHPLAHERVRKRADAGDLDLADVAVLQVLRAALGAHPNDVAGIERQVLRHAADELGDPVDHVVGAEMVGDLAVDPYGRLGLVEVEIGLDPWPHRLEGVGVLGAPQGPVAAL